MTGIHPLPHANNPPSGLHWARAVLAKPMLNVANAARTQRLLSASRTCKNLLSLSSTMETSHRGMSRRRRNRGSGTNDRQTRTPSAAYTSTMFLHGDPLVLFLHREPCRSALLVYVARIDIDLAVLCLAGRTGFRSQIVANSGAVLPWCFRDKDKADLGEAYNSISH